MTDSPPHKSDQFIVRLPDGMRDRIKRAAASNNRSMNAEVVATLEEKYPGEVLAELDDLLSMFAEASVELALSKDDPAQLAIAQVFADAMRQDIQDLLLFPEKRKRPASPPASGQPSTVSPLRRA